MEATRGASTKGVSKNQTINMKFPNTNKVHQDLHETFGENAALLEEKLKAINWRLFLKFYFAALGVLLVSLFALIVVVKAALVIF